MSAGATTLPFPGLLAACALGLWAGCSDGEGEPADPRTDRPAEAAVEIATRADPAGRLAVATVDGEPIYGDCVATQAAAAGIDRDAALARCIDFEVLAQEARRRGLLADPDVLEARRTEMVRAVVEVDFAPTLDDPSDVPVADVRWLWDTQLSGRYNRPELRRATYCRAPVAERAAAGGPEDRQARILAERLHGAFSGMRGLEPATFSALCWMTAGGHEVKTTAAPTNPFDSKGRHQTGYYAVPFAEAAFTIAEVAGISRPTRTSWGWDILLLTEIVPAESRSFADAEQEIREILVRQPEAAEYRQRRFEVWIRRTLAAARVELFPDNLPDEQALARSAGPTAPGAGP